MSWSNYKWRFTPWIARRLARQAAKTTGRRRADATVDLVRLRAELLLYLRSLQRAHDEARACGGRLLPALGFALRRRSSTLGGDGVFVADGAIECGSLAALYPGTVYAPHEPLFWQSLGNQFILRRKDALRVDGNDAALSAAIIFRSCAGRDRPSHVRPACDASWLRRHGTPVNELAVGQYVNNATSARGNNVAYIELDVPLCHVIDHRHDLRRWLPYVSYKSAYCHSGKVHCVALAATRRISVGEELLSTYFTLVDE